MMIRSGSANQTLLLGKRLSRHLKAGDIVCLFGELGSGKTVLAKGIASGLGIAPQEVVSPTFVLIREYAKARIPLYHFDLYRLKRPADIMGLGYEEYLYGNGITVIEWAERLAHLIPREYLKVKLSVTGGNSRRIDVNPIGKGYQRLTHEIHRA